MVPVAGEDHAPTTAFATKACPRVPQIRCDRFPCPSNLVPLVAEARGLETPPSQTMPPIVHHRPRRQNQPDASIRTKSHWVSRLNRLPLVFADNRQIQDSRKWGLTRLATGWVLTLLHRLEKYTMGRQTLRHFLRKATKQQCNDSDSDT